MLQLKMVFALFLGFFLTGCATDQSNHFRSGKINETDATSYGTNLYHKTKHPHLVAFYHHKSLIKRPYRIIGKETVSRNNFIGLERQNGALTNLMRKIAASMGGDAVINITQDTQKIEGTVISYERVLL